MNNNFNKFPKNNIPNKPYIIEGIPAKTSVVKEITLTNFLFLAYSFK
mgnify:CR=1 FL=1